ncbi:RelA/SpoT family protein [Thermomonospora amylolytica]|uniref:RelA/SpoT family protein n=1 Tax=Thermomonospora amylolytica TaxID=1411117 RepID=UPI001F2C718C|nr:HD domain-containing protein [Thermomonospora amylolytica]
MTSPVPSRPARRAAARRGRAMLPWGGPGPQAARRAAVRSALAPLLAAHRAAFPAGDPRELCRAYDVAERMHRGQLRKSGAPYVTHPLAVAMILAGLGMDTTTLVAALLHDTVEDTPYTLGEVRADFGEEVAVLVDGVTKLDGERWGERREAETFRKIVLAAAADLRVLVIKLADRLHNLRTLGHVPEHKRRRYATASLELLVPFAERLGIHALKREMDDLAFAHRDPAAHAATAAAMRQALLGADAVFGPALRLLRGSLAEHRLDAEVSVRPRHLYAVHQDHAGDVAGLRPCQAARVLIVVDGGEQDCYVALGAVHAALHPCPGRVRDYIALPKFNLYQALHTRVISPDGDPLDVIIQSRAMRPVAEHGIVAHIRAAGADTAGTVAGRRDLVWLSRLLAWQSDATSAAFLDGLRIDLAGGNIAVFTPAGDVVALPHGATALDFAYALGTETGAHSIGALINGRLAPLSAELRSGYVVEILTDPEGSPTPDWLQVATTAPARVHIQSWLSGRQTEEAAALGRHRLARLLADHDLDLLTAEAHGTSLSIARDLGFTEIDDMYAAIATGSLPLDALLPRFTAS